MANCPILGAALEYHRRGWSVIPLRPRDKKPALRSWKPYQAKRPDEAQVRDWFRDADADQVGVGILLGTVSDGLIVRDFDRMDVYDHWAADRPELARTLPTVETGRPGRHVYFRGSVLQIRTASKTGNGCILTLNDGELKAGGYVVAPPSVHPSGKRYRWSVPLGESIPLVDLREAGLLPPTESGHATEKPEDIVGVLSPLTLLGHSQSAQCSQLHGLDLSNVLDDAEILGIIRRNLPSGYGNRNRSLFGLVRDLKAIPRLAGCDPRELRPVVKQWHKLALPNVRTKAFEESWLDFVNAWAKARCPKGTGRLAELLTVAAQEAPPSIAMQYEQHQVRLLASLCRVLQRAAEREPFFLAINTAAELLRVNRSTISRWLRLLCIDGVLVLVEKGSQAKKRASRYRYVAEL